VSALVPAQRSGLNLGVAPTMTSREIAELTGREHDNVRRDIKNMAEALSLNLEEKLEPSSGGRPSKVYLLPKRESLILVSGYNLQMRAKIIDRWQELEARSAATPAIPTNFAEALQLAADQAKRIEQQEATITGLTPKAAALDRLSNADGLLSLTEASKLLGVKLKDFTRDLQMAGWIYKRPGQRSWLGYADKVAAGLVDHKEARVAQADGSERLYVSVRFPTRALTRWAERYSGQPGELFQ
jgi:phage regulator Rha-like protein